MGTPTFALPALEALTRAYQVSAVLSKPDAVSHRGKTLMPSLVKARATELGIPVYTPKGFYARYDAHTPLLGTKGGHVIDADVLAQIKKHEPDVIVVAAFGLLVPPEILELPKYGCLNIHASLLPSWRGAAPIQRAILAGDEYMGVSVMRMEAGLDTGPYCLQAATPARNKSYQELIEEMGSMGAELICPNLEAIVAGEFDWTAQDPTLVTYADKLPKGAINLDEQLTVFENYNRVRASNHHARCRSVLFNKQVILTQARPATERESKKVYFECSDGLLEILKLKPDGSREMTGSAFLAGLR